MQRRADGRPAYSDIEERVEQMLVTLGLDTSSLFCVDIAAADGRQGSNTYFLFRKGARGVAVEANAGMFSRLALNYADLPSVILYRGIVTPLNVVSLLRAADVPLEFTFLSLDIDGYDHDVLDETLANYRPKLMCVEVNERIPPPVRFAFRYTPNSMLVAGECYGQSLSELHSLANRHGYVIIDLWYNNALLIPRETGNAGDDIVTLYRRGYLDRPDRLKRFPWNQPYEIVHGMRPFEVVAYLNARPDFVANAGRYDLTAE